MGGRDLYPGYEHVASQLSTLLSTYPPSFIYLYDSECPRIATSCVLSVLDTLSAGSIRFAYACVSAVACFTPRLFYDTTINALARHTPNWEDDCENWTGPIEQGQRWNESLDTFLHGLRAVRAEVEKTPQTRTTNGKGKAAGPSEATNAGRCRMVLVVECAERLKETSSELLVPLTRLAEMSQVDIVTILISDVRWEDIRPPLGVSPEPFYMDVPAPSKQAILEMLVSRFPPDASSITSSTVDPDTYNLIFQPLYAHFVATVYSICGPFTHDPHELGYIAAACWPGFVQPVLDQHNRHLRLYEEYRASRREDTDEDFGPPELALPTEDARLRLTRMLTPSLTAALESLYPRATNATDWARTHAPPPDLLAIHPSQVPQALQSASAAREAGNTKQGVEGLPRMAKFVLVAAFLASTNPPKSDVRMFGRGPDGRKRRRRKGGSPRKSKSGTATKIPQRLLGPTSFSLDRLLAILGVLLEENDAEIRPPAPQYTVPGEYTDVEISRVVIFAQVMELASMRLLLRTSPVEKIDNAPTFKCGISYDTALALARDVGILLNSLIWEGVQYGN